MKPFGALLSYSEAQKVVDSHITPLTRTEKVKLDDASGRVLAEDITASAFIPAFDRAAMDGYAVKAKDTFGAGQFKPRILPRTGQVHAGQKPGQKVGSGECVQVATGAMMPAGADAVVMVEDTDRDGESIKVFRSVTPGTNVARKGVDIKKDEIILKEGTLLDPGKIGVLASQGLTGINVWAMPVISIMPTGEEIVEIGKRLKPGQVYDINSHTIAALVQANGGIPERIRITGDKAEEIKGNVSTALKNDMVVLSGGSSVGERDLLVDVLQGWGQVLFHGIQIRPGKPTLFAILEGKPLMGMPGYPTSCLINAYLFLLPAVRKMAHLPPRKGQTVTAKLAQRVPGNIGRRQFLTVKVANGEAIAVFKESGAITSIAAADGYIEIPENIDLVEKGEEVTVTLF